MRILLAVVVSLVVSVTAEAAGQPSPDYGLKNVWPATWVYPPHRKGLPFRVGDKERWDKAAASITSPVPAVIYMHGCAGFSWNFLEAAYAKALSKAGFLVLVPDSYARGPRRREVCGKVRIDTVELRREEVREVLRQIGKLPWVDRSNLFLAGHSEGGITTSMFGGSQFRAYFIAGWTCTSKAPEFDRIHAPKDRPVLAVVGTFAVQNSITDVYWMLAFGIVGYFLKVYGFPVAPVILGIILGPLMDASYRRAMISAREDIGRFLMEFVTTPISLILTIGFILLVLGQTPLWSRIVRRRRAGAP